MEEEKFQTSFLAPMKEGLAKDASFMYYVGGEERHANRNDCEKSIVAALLESIHESKMIIAIFKIAGKMTLLLDREPT